MRPRSDDDAGQWRRVRRYLNENRHALTHIADTLYPDAERVQPTPLLCQPAWIPSGPVSLADVKLTWDVSPPLPLITGAEPQSEYVRGGSPAGAPFPSYAEALAALDPPEVLENRTCYRLTGLSFDAGSTAMTFGPGAYFDGVNVSEALAHELAAWHMTYERQPRLTDLPFRSLVGDPTDLIRRPVTPAISALTLRQAPGQPATFLLHHRDATRVTHGGGLYQVIPVGVFQPSTDDDTALRADFDLWRCLVREYGEEMLGAPETPPGDKTFDYDASPLYRILTGAREDGSLRSFVLGVGVDPLSLVTDILVVTVIDAEVFDQAFGQRVTNNAEGRILSPGTHGFDFSQRYIERFAKHEPMQAAGVAALALAWRRRQQLVAS